MLEPPDLPDGRIIAAVRRYYGLEVTTLAFLPLGADVRSWAFRATTADASSFLKLRQGAVREATLRVPRYLLDQGVPHIVAPLPARDQRPWVEVDDYTLALYPFIDGTTAMARGLEERHWVMYGAALRAMHDTPLAPDLAPVVPRESFSTALGDAVRALDSDIESRTSADPVERDLAAFWRSRRAEIEALLDRFERLSRQLRDQPPPLVLCHADVHPNNVLIDSDEQLWIVDWDDTHLAPKECDLMMGVGGLGNYPAGPRETGWFLRGYGSTDIDPVALDYYRHVRALGDILYNGEQVVRLPGASELIKRDGLRRMGLLFAPGYMVSLALPRRGDA
jgi:spectinomycin phosphotransferase